MRHLTYGALSFLTIQQPLLAQHERMPQSLLPHCKAVADSESGAFNAMLLMSAKLQAGTLDLQQHVLLPVQSGSSDLFNYMVLLSAELHAG